LLLWYECILICYNKKNRKSSNICDKNLWQNISNCWCWYSKKSWEWSQAQQFRPIGCVAPPLHSGKIAWSGPNGPIRQPHCELFPLKVCGSKQVWSRDIYGRKIFHLRELLASKYKHKFVYVRVRTDNQRVRTSVAN
jgi:hypothetical protein